MADPEYVRDEAPYPCRRLGLGLALALGPALSFGVGVGVSLSGVSLPGGRFSSAIEDILSLGECD